MTAKSLLLLILVGCRLAATQDSPSRFDGVVNRPDRQWFMGSVLVARDGKIVFEKNYGDANREQHIPIVSQSRFRIGSLSKQFTAAAILILEGRGRLLTSDPVRRYLPGAPAAWDRITVYNLLTHTSGIPDYVNSSDFDSIKAKQMTPDQVIRRFRDQPLDFAPGVKEDYSNSNYALLGRIVESVSGQSYAAFMRANIFQPLAMGDSGVDTGERQIDNEAIGYALDGADITPAAYVNMSTCFGAGAIYSTVEDLLRWEQGLFEGKLLSPAGLKKMTTVFLNGCACGLHVGNLGHRKVIYHSGIIDGFSSYMEYYPDEKLAVIALSNVCNRQMAAIVNELANTASER